MTTNMNLRLEKMKSKYLDHKDVEAIVNGLNVLITKCDDKRQVQKIASALFNLKTKAKNDKQEYLYNLVFDLENQIKSVIRRLI